MAKSTTSKAPEWKPFAEEQYREAIFRLVHFSTKTINSNAKAVGIRLSNTNARSQPYLCASSALASGHSLPLDYLTNSGPAATIAKQVEQILTGELPEDIDPNEVKCVKQLHREASQVAFETGMEKVSPRVRQLFLPCDGGDYVAITPITSSGLTAIVHEQTRANLERWRESRDKQEPNPSQPGIRRLRTAYLGFGGDNAQNIGRLPNRGFVQYPLFFSAPRSAKSVREQYLAAHCGVRPLLNPAIMREMRDTLMPIKLREGGELPSNLKTRELIDKFAERLTNSLLQRAEQTQRDALEILSQQADSETDQPSSIRWTHLPETQQGLLSPDLRDRHWRQELANQLTQTIDDYTYPEEMKRGRLSFNATWLDRIRKHIEEQLL
ncbi:MAG: hypothetical protein GYB28_18625 [Gammaproteobacteria bacterium]|uniref:Uncharacterized protein n=1 Tax=Vreelandella venusta TaxID=44935 RepID=A0ABX2BHT0_9GAMM|nr:type I-F CRISPR-associated protein Csy1 [Halomonas venusta]AZM95354.1 hypothetical protein EI420_06480 [Halomonas venusta]MBR9926991.1 hypothetical protein [Gammaproteobacteria bacterium]NPT32639.1 hypothetical protein [Halomonas venusta]